MFYSLTHKIFLYFGDGIPTIIDNNNIKFCISETDCDKFKGNLTLAKLSKVSNSDMLHTLWCNNNVEKTWYLLVLFGTWMHWYC